MSYMLILITYIVRHCEKSLELIDIQWRIVDIIKMLLGVACVKWSEELRDAGQTRLYPLPSGHGLVHEDGNS